MTFAAVTLRPGVDTEATPTLLAASYTDCNLIRWKEGISEKIGGWVRFYPSSVGSIPRALWSWQDLNTNLRLAVGATSSLSVITNGTLQNITPQLTTTNSTVNFTTVINTPTITIVDSNISNPTINNFVFISTPVSIGGIVLSGIYAIASILSATSYTITAATNATGNVNNGGAVALFTTVSGSATVTVTLNNHGVSAQQTVYISVATTVGGITISGSYIVQSVVDANNFTITAATTATSSTSGSENGGNVRFIYYVTIGPQASSAGYGTGTYGGGGYGTGIAPPTGTGTPITALDWSLGNWGEILLACPQGGGIYQWGPEGGFLTAQLVSSAPIVNVGMFVTMPQQIVVALGASATGAPSPMRVAWSNAGDYTNWTPTSSNFAGAYTIPRGSMIVGGMQAPTQNLIWTDLGLWSMQFIGQPLVFAFNEIMAGCGLIGSHAASLLGGVVFWMSQKQIFMMPAGGGPSPLPCKVWDFIFQNLDTTNAYKIRCATNAAFNEVAWHFPVVGGNGENSAYIKYNVVEGEWDKGNYPTGRSAWIDQSVLGTPIGGDPNGIIFQHEQGYNGDGAAYNPFLLSGYFVLQEAEDFAFVDQFLPDARYGLLGGNQTAQMLFTLYTVDYPNGPITTYGPYSMSSSVNSVSTRVRGRQMSIRMESQDSSSFWRMGRTRFRMASDGRR